MAAIDPWKAGERVGCCGAFGKKKEQQFQQTIVVLRHSERLDHMDPNYPNTEEGKEFPFDTPLTEAGIDLAKKVAVEMEELHKTANFAMIACSPYKRCMQTATQVAKRLNLPIVIDQEVGEVWEEAMPKERPPHRSPIQLQMMAKELGIKVGNPLLPEGGYKMFGKQPFNYPETIRMGHERCIVRVQTYIENSVASRQNFIIVSHAPAVAAMTSMFMRGMCDVEKLEYCARVIARRSVLPSKVAEDSSVYADQWDVSSAGVATGLNFEASEDAHLKDCEDTQVHVVKRKEKRTTTDFMFDNAIAARKEGKLEMLNEEEEEESDAKAKEDKNRV